MRERLARLVVGSKKDIGEKDDYDGAERAGPECRESQVDSLSIEMSIAKRMVEGDEYTGMTMRWCEGARWGPQLISSGKTARDEGKFAHDDGMVAWRYGET